MLPTRILIQLPPGCQPRSQPGRPGILRGTGIAISAIVMGLAWLATHDRLEITGTLEPFVEKISSRTAIQPVTVKVAALANQLPANYSGDPCDRLIAARQR